MRIQPNLHLSMPFIGGALLCQVMNFHCGISPENVNKGKHEQMLTGSLCKSPVVTSYHVKWCIYTGGTIQMGRLGGIAQIVLIAWTDHDFVRRRGCGEAEKKKLEHLRHEIRFRFP